MASFPILSTLLALPILGAIACLLSNANGARWIALLTTLGVFALSVGVWLTFQIGGPQWQFTEYHPIFGMFAWALGIDGIALMLIVLTAFLMPICIAASWKSIQSRVQEFMACFLLMETTMLGVFAAQDIYLFYIFFEMGLIPMYLIIGIWGGVNRIYAAYKFFLYTLLGSVLMLIAMLWMVNYADTTSIPALMETDFPVEAQNWLWLAFFASFAVKMPMWPVHTWLPDAHVQAPTAGSVILAGVLLKMGGYGFLRFSLPMFPLASAQFDTLVFALSVVAVIYTSLVAWRQTDIKKLIAYSSVAHMGLVTIGIFAANEVGVQGAIFQMLSHGIISGALFLIVGVIYDRMHTREIDFYGGLVHRMPVYAVIFSLFTMANVGLPGTSGFVGEILSMAGGYLVAPWIAFGAAFGVILSAVYMLTLYRRVAFGQLTNPKLANIQDLTRLEITIFVPLVVGTLLLGVMPSLVTDITEASVVELVENYAAALAPAAQAIELPVAP